MTLYIVRPKASLRGQFPALSDRKIDSEKRRKQLEEVAQFWQEEKAYREIQDWIEDESPEAVKAIAAPSPTLTGTRFLEMPDPLADRLKREVANIIILQDEPIELIRPTQSTETRKERLETEDIWHLQAIARSESKKTGKDIKVAVFDTGIDASHGEIEGKVTSSYCLNFRGAVGAWNIEPMDCEDTQGHGTHVAGLICGKTVGIARDAALINMLLLPRGSGTVRNFIMALEWLLQREDVRIANISAGVSAKFREQMSDVVNDLLAFGILPICAIGNEGRNITSSPGNCQGVLSVGACDRDGKVAGFSSSAKMVVDDQEYLVPSLVAPGKGVYSAVMGGGYEAWNGTSMATPIVSGIAALILEEDPIMSAYDLREALLDRCRSLPGQSAVRQGEGLIRVQL
ncbi:MAG: S8 family serine peptidase [Cyanobacteria bacterium P01_E01_bin.42]